MVFDREDLQHQPEISFSYRELDAITRAAKGDSDVQRSTLKKLKILAAYSRTKDAYALGDTVITAK